MTRRKIYVIPGSFRDQFVIRFVVCSRFTIQEDIAFAWNEISNQATEVLQENEPCKPLNGECNISTKEPAGEIASRVKKIEMKNKKFHSTFMVK